MNIKWKVLIISMLIYQIILTIVMLNLSHYSQWIYFSDSTVGLPSSWLEGNHTLPMKKALITLGVSAFFLGIINFVVFKKNEEPDS